MTLVILRNCKLKIELKLSIIFILHLMEYIIYNISKQMKVISVEILKNICIY